MKTPINTTILKNLFHSHRKSFLILGISLALFELMMHWFVAASDMSKVFSQFMQVAPPAMKNLLGGDVLSFYTPRGMMSIAYTHPGIFFLLLTAPALFLNAEIAAAREKGILALNLSRPVSRFSYLCNLLIVFTVGLIFLGISAAAGVKLSFVLYNIDQPIIPFLYALINVVLLTFLLGSIAMFISVAAKSGSSATGWMIGVPLALYLLEYVSKTIEAASFYSPVNPFHYYQPQTTIANGVCSTSDCLVLFFGSFIFIALAFWVFKHKDI